MLNSGTTQQNVGHTYFALLTLRSAVYIPPVTLDNPQGETTQSNTRCSNKTPTLHAAHFIHNLTRYRTRTLHSHSGLHTAHSTVHTFHSTLHTFHPTLHLLLKRYTPHFPLLLRTTGIAQNAVLYYCELLCTKKTPPYYFVLQACTNFSVLFIAINAPPSTRRWRSFKDRNPRRGWLF